MLLLVISLSERKFRLKLISNEGLEALAVQVVAEGLEVLVQDQHFLGVPGQLLGVLQGDKGVF